LSTTILLQKAPQLAAAEDFWLDAAVLAALKLLSSLVAAVAL
jgi:hypothetical protein